MLPIAKSFLDRTQSEPQAPLPLREPLDLSHLSHYVRTASFSYAQRSIKVKHYHGDRPDLTTLHEPLFPPPTLLHKGNFTHIILPDILPPLELSIPDPPIADTSILTFGAATKVLRLEDAIPQFQHWLTDTSSQLHVLTPAPEEGRKDRGPELQNAMQDLGINVTVTPTDAAFPQAYFSLIKHLYDRRTPKTKWIVLIDDDTFIPSLPYLVDHLNKNYDSSKQQIISATSDNLGQIHMFGMLPFGGGGIFISIPLAEHLTKQEIWDDCLRSERTQGDQIVNECLNEHSQVRPIWDERLNQMDIHDDASGYFESGRRMLTVHHWRSWFDVNVAAAANVSRVTGNEGIFQRWSFDSDASSNEGGMVVLSNGYSITEYPEGISGEDLAKVELTWDKGMEERWRWVHKIGPLRDKLKPELKRQARLVGASVIEGVGVRQTYIEYGEGAMMGKVTKRKEERIDRVVELVWLF